MKYKKYPNDFINSINNKKYKELLKDEKKLIREMYETKRDIWDNAPRLATVK